MNQKHLRTHKLLVHKETLPCGPAFGYFPIRKEITELEINGYLTETIRLPSESEIKGQYKHVLDGEPKPKCPPTNKQTFIQKTLGYRCNQYNLDDRYLHGCWPVTDVFATREEAEKQTKFTSVKLPFRIYHKALGVDEKGERLSCRDSETSTTECDLPICCANISEVRDRLIECMKNKGLEQWKIDLIKDYLESSHPEILEAGKSKLTNLDQILKALGILKPV